MKKILLLTTGLFMTILAFCQKPEIKNGVMSFSTVESYENYADKVSNINDVDQLENSFVSLRQLQNTSEDSQYPDFLLKVLNRDNVVEIEGYLIRIDLINQKFIAIKNNNKNAYNTLLSNDLYNENVIKFNVDVEDALQVLKGIDKSELSVSDYNNASADARIRWPWNNCKGAPAKKIDGIEADWRKPSFDKKCGYGIGDDNMLYYMDNKLVYQKAVIYFSIQAKIKSVKKCRFSNFYEHHFADLRLVGICRYVRVSNCSNEFVPTENRVELNEREMNWRAYEGSKALYRYIADVDFAIKENGTTTWVPSMHYQIKYGY